MAIVTSDPVGHRLLSQMTCYFGSQSFALIGLVLKSDVVSEFRLAGLAFLLLDPRPSHLFH